MKSSESISELAAALAAFQSECPPITADEKVDVKTKSGKSYGFGYASHNKINTIIGPLLSKHKLAITQPINDGSIETIVMHESGQFIASSIKIESDELMENKIQAFGSAVSYLRRYAIESILNLTITKSAPQQSSTNKTTGSSDGVDEWLNKYDDAARKNISPYWLKVVRDLALEKPTGTLDTSNDRRWIYQSISGRKYKIAAHYHNELRHDIDLERLGTSASTQTND